MRLNDVIYLLQLLRVGQIDVLSEGRWVRSRCPLAPFTHIGGTDSNPSFCIRVDDNGPSSFNCFTCGSGSLKSLIHRMTWTIGLSSEVHAHFMMKEFLPSSPSTYKDPIIEWPDRFASLDSLEASRAIPVPDLVLNEYPLLKDGTDYPARRSRDWFCERGISLDVVYEYGTRYDPYRDGMVFPIMDVDNKIYLLHYRSRKDKIFYYINPIISGFRDLIWGISNFFYGIHLIDFSKPIIVVESETDLLKLKTFNVPNIVSTCGPVSVDKMKRIKESPHVYMGYDSDLVGAKYCFTTIKALHEHTLLSRLSWIIAGKKDAGALDSREEFDDVWAGQKAVQFTERGVIIEQSENLVYNDVFNTSHSRRL